MPGWGYLYRWFVGSFERDWLWEDSGERWIRGKLHRYEMSLRIAGWSNRQTFFLERFYDLPTQLVLQQALKEGDVFIDVGANEGMMALLGSALVGNSGKVICFEPNVTPRKILEENLQRNGIMNVDVNPFGLGDRNSVHSLFVPYINTGEGSFVGNDSIACGHYISCDVFVGDEIINDENPRLIKIDVEGFEGRVLRGLSRTISRSKPILCIEMIEGHLARDGETPKAICEWLIEFGYDCHRMGLANRKSLALSLMSGDWQDGDYLFIHPNNPL